MASTIEPTTPQKTRALAAPSTMIALGLIACSAIFAGTFAHRDGEAIVSRDSHQYWEIGRNLALGHGFTYDGEEPTRMRQPLYPMTIAAVTLLFGDGTTPVVMLQLLLALGIVLTVAAMAREVFGPTAAGVAGLIAGGYYPFGVLANEIRTESLFILLVSLAVLYWIRASRRHSLKLVVACGVLLGLAILTRSAAFVFALLLPAALWWQFGRGRRGLRASAIAAGVLVVTLSPWAVRNALSLGEWTALSNAGPAAFYCGLHPMALTHWEDYMTAIERTEEYRRLRGDSDFLGPEAGDRFRKAAIERVKREPLTTTAQCVAKVVLAWTYAPGSRPLLDDSPLRFRLFQIPQIALLIIIGMGWWHAPPAVRWTAILLFAGVSLTVFIGTPTARYTLPFMPLGLALAASPLALLLPRGLTRPGAAPPQ